MIFCQSQRGPEGYWSYRIVDGRHCWYLGSSRISKSQLVWGGTKQPAKEVVVERKAWSNDELEKLIKTPVPASEPPAPVIWDADQLNPLDQQLIDSELTPQQRIDGAFDALGIGRKNWIEPYLGPSVTSAADGSAAAAVREDAAVAVPLRDSIEIALMLGVVMLAMLLWRGVAVTFGTIGRAQ